ncbi:MAG: hypothetical protein L6R42_001020, partial [Xanthoria sp. 1 TBL-2021]
LREALCFHGSPIVTFRTREAAPSQKLTPPLTVSSVASLPARTLLRSAVSKVEQE